MKKNSDDENKIVMVIEEIEKTTWTTASMQDEVIEAQMEEIDIAKNEEEFMIYSKAVQIKEIRAAVPYLLCYLMVMQPRIITFTVEKFGIACNCFDEAVVLKMTKFNFYTVQTIIDHLSMLLEADLILIMFYSVTNTLAVFRCSILMCCMNMGIHWTYYLILIHIIMISSIIIKIIDV